MRQLLALVLLLLAVPVTAAPRRRVVAPAPRQVVVSDDFRLGTRGWEAGFADYSPMSADMELAAGLRPLPAELGIDGTGFMLSGHNRSDDLFMFLTRKLTATDGIRANQRYEISYRLIFASNAGGTACSGIGGHPGFSVSMKAGGSGEEPRIELDASAHLRVSVDKGNQSTGGPAATVAGDISTGSSDCRDTAPYKTLELRHRHTYPVQANHFAELWLLVGTDSGFEGKTTLYYEMIEATLTPR